MLAATALNVLLCVVGAPSGAATALHPAPPLPEGWVVAPGAPKRDESFRAVQLALAPANPEAPRRIAAMAVERATPGNVNYGLWLSMDEVNAELAPAAAAVDAVTAWVASVGATASVSRRGAVVTVGATVSQLEALFGTEVARVASAATAQSTLRAVGNASLPAAVAAVVKAVHGLHGLPLPPRAPVAPPARASASAAVPKVTPAVLSQYYGIKGVTVGAAANRQAVGEFQGQTFEASDLTKFFREYVAGDTKPEDAAIDKVVGSNPRGPSGVEAALDVEYIMGVAPGVKTEFWGFEAQDFCADLKSFASTILSTDAAPSVFSISYGWQGPLAQLNCADAAVADVDGDLAAIAARGISVLISSGDSGSAATSGGGPPAPPVACSHPASNTQYSGDGVRVSGFLVDSAAACCSHAVAKGFPYWTFVKGAPFKPHECLGFSNVTGKVQNPKATSGRAAPPSPGPPGPPPVPGLVLYPSWPASSPWVTAVGATRFIDQDPTGAAGEMATDQFGSGGGFSAMFDRGNASWQDTAVSAYFSADAGDLPPTGSYPAGGRGTPDVSALGEGFQVIASGQTQSVGGTSASAPTFAGMISLLNDARMQKGMPALGFLNPWLYKNRAMFRDVTKGSNKISRSGSTFRYGWECTEGWDAATGLGTPLFPKMLEAALAPAAVEL
mmetsp:Transcript_13494/g.34635  ORF Transcript_13494/g.34635 Transcript_13494/m.34635 type:complete len:672 (-) Transcript_13494:181-2196(-)